MYYIKNHTYSSMSIDAFDEATRNYSMFNMIAKSGLGKLFCIYKIDKQNKDRQIGTFIDESGQEHIIDSTNFKYDGVVQNMCVYTGLRTVLDESNLERCVRKSIINKCLYSIGQLGLHNASKYDDLTNVDIYNNNGLKGILDLLLCKIHMINTDADDQQTFIYIGSNILDKYPIFDLNPNGYSDDIFNIGTYSNHSVYSSNLTEGDNSNMIIVGIKPNKNQQGLRFIYDTTDITEHSYKFDRVIQGPMIYTKLTVFYSLEAFSMNPERYYIGIIM